MLFTNKLTKRRTDASNYAEGENNNNGAVSYSNCITIFGSYTIGNLQLSGLVTSVFLGSFKLLVEPWRA